MFEGNKNFVDYIQCHVFEQYTAQSLNVTSCWDFAKKSGDFRFTYNVCQDCIVYIYSCEKDKHARQYIEKILAERSKTRVQKDML